MTKQTEIIDLFDRIHDHNIDYDTSIGTAKYFNIERSMKEAPPDQNRAFKAFKEGSECKFKKRMVVAIDDIALKRDKQARYMDDDEENIVRIRDSLLSGWLYSEQPPMGTWDEESRRFNLEYGFHRVSAARAIGWTHILMDVYDVPSPRHMLQVKLNENNHVPHKGQTDTDIIESIKRSIKNSEIDATPEEIKSVLPERLAQRKVGNIISSVMSTNSDSAMVAYSKNSKHDQDKNPDWYGREKLNIPTSKNNVIFGNKVYEGNINGAGDGRQYAVDAMKKFVKDYDTILSDNENIIKDENIEMLRNRPIRTLAGYIKKPCDVEYNSEGVLIKQNKLEDQRKKHLQEHYSTHDAINKWFKAELATNSDGIITKEQLLKIFENFDKSPKLIHFIGFLPQKHSPDTKQGGNRTEGDNLYNYKGECVGNGQTRESFNKLLNYNHREGLDD